MQNKASVSAKWLLENFECDDVCVFDCSWHLPAAGRDGAAEFRDAHIPGAHFFNIDTIVDPASPLPHTLPDPATFEKAAQALGINQNSHVVFYDISDLKSAARGWWMMRAMGHERVSVLDGGLRAWQAAGGTIEQSITTRETGDFKANFRPDLVRGKDDIVAIIENGGDQIIDARANARFRGDAPEPRAGVRSGHMPGALNLPYGSLYDADGRLKPTADLKAIFQAAGIDTGGPIVASCGSGVTACNLAHALFELGNSRAAVYDGSWSEWGRADDVPIETGS